MLGIQAASRAVTKSVQAGHFRLVASIMSVNAMTAMAVVGISSRDCPSLSTQREICGARIALASVNVAATAPASQYSPRLCDSMVTIPIGAMVTDSRAMNAAAAKPFVPRAWKRVLYGLAIVLRRVKDGAAAIDRSMRASCAPLGKH